MSANGSSSSPTISASSVGFSHNILASSISSSLSAASRPSHISKTYRQASTLFLTRRLPEALTTLLPLITPPEPVDDGEPAPVARASRTTRVKVWSLYLTILNAILEMEADEGKDAFGTQEWRAICNKVREGEVWDEVIRNGYHGVEGDVDSDVVINLATLLLAHARDQTLNQKKLEAFLAASNTPNLDLAGRLAESSPERRMSNRYRSPVKGTSGANTPRDLNARVKILELYTLHVLLRNNEWDYAREFISVSSVLDEERREAFLQALQSLQEEQQEQERLEKEERQRQEDQLRKDIEEAKKLRAENEERERRRLEEERARREGSEIDYGIDETRSHTGSSSKSRHARTHSNASRQSKSSSTSASGFRQNGKAVTRPTLTSRASMVVTRLRTVVEHLSKLLNGNPMLLVRFLAFLIGLILMLSHKGVRARVQRILAGSWNKLKATAGMGVKVSYM